MDRSEDVDLRLVRSFVAVAEAGNITRAAGHLHLAQQALSSQMRRLERQLGLRLFDRLPNGVRLTSAGNAYLLESRKTLAQARRAVEAANRAASSPGRRRIVVAYKARATAHLAAPLVDTVAERDPGLDVELLSANTLDEELGAVRVGPADAAFVWLPTGAEDLRAELVGRESWVVAVASTHPLADRDGVDLADLASDPVVGPHDSQPQVVTAAWTMDPRPGGAQPVLGPVARTPEDCLQLVASGRGVWFAPESVSGYFGRPSVSWLTVEGPLPAEVGVVFRPDRADASMRTLIDCARETYWKG